MMDKQKQFIFISLGVVALIAALVISIPRTEFTSSVVDLLPNEKIEFKILRELGEHDQGRLLTIRLFSKYDTVSTSTGQLFLETLQQNPHIETVWLADESALEAAGANLFKNRYQWLLPNWLEQSFPEWKKDRSIDSNLLAQKVVEKMDRYLASPEGTTLVELIPKDPFILMEHVLNSTTWLNQPLEKNGSTLWVRQRFSPFTEAGQTPVFEALETALLEARELTPSLEMEYSGVSRFAAASKAGIKGEIQRLNLLGLLLVLTVTAYWVRSFRLTLQIFLVVGIALATAATTVILVFPSVHIISLVIGSILTGIAVDYAFHLILAEPRGLNKQTITKAVVTGSISSAFGFIILLWAPLPFLKQVGAFVGSGLIAALLTALVLRFGKRNQPPRRLWLLNPFSLPAWTGPLLVLLSTPGLRSIEWKDRINDLEYPLPELKSIEQRLRWQSQPDEPQTLYLAYGDSLMSARERLQQLNFDSNNAQLLHLGRWIPDLESIQATHKYFKDQSEFASVLRQTMEDHGYYSKEFDAFFESWETYLHSDINEITYSSAVAQFAATLPGPLASLVHAGEELSWFMALGSSSFQQQETDGIIQLDQAKILSSAFLSYRQTVIFFSGFCLMGLSIAVLSIYGLTRGAAALALPTVSVLTAFGICGYFGTSLGLFHVVGTLLAFCISLDYALFSVVAHHKHCRLPASVSISAITTIGAFFILTTSSIPAIQQLSVTILLIISMSLLLITAGWPFVRRGAVPGRWSFRLLPHGEEALFIRNVETLSETNIETRCESNLANHLEAEWILEAMAQSAAVLLAYNKGKQNQPRSGMIVVVQQFKRHLELDSLDPPLSCKVESLTDGEEGLLLFKGSCSDKKDTTVAESAFSIFIPPIKS